MALLIFQSEWLHPLYHPMNLPYLKTSFVGLLFERMVLGLWGASCPLLTYDWYAWWLWFAQLAWLPGKMAKAYPVECNTGPTNRFLLLLQLPHHSHLLFHCVTSKVNDLPPCTACTVDEWMSGFSSLYLEWWNDISIWIIRPFLEDSSNLKPPLTLGAKSIIWCQVIIQPSLYPLSQPYIHNISSICTESTKTEASTSHYFTTLSIFENTVSISQNSYQQPPIFNLHPVQEWTINGGGVVGSANKNGVRPHRR